MAHWVDIRPLFEVCEGYMVRRRGDEEEGVVVPRGDKKTTSGHPGRFVGS